MPVALVNIPRLPAGTKIINPDGSANQEFAIFWDQFAALLEKTLTDLDAVDTELAAMIAAIAAAQAAADQAAIDAAAAQATADAAQDDAIAALADAAAAAIDAANAAADAANAAADALAAQNDATDALADAAAAQATATTANSTANTANTTANTVKRDLAVSTGYPAPGDVLSAADVGADATITIDAHERVYGDIANLAVSGGTLTGCAFSTKYYIYYDDTTRADTTPNYQKTTNVNVAVPQKAAGRHYVGDITTPADGGGATTGGAAPPSGGGGISRSEVSGSFS
jgi:ABC-type transporter Mla subunit MlaD